MTVSSRGALISSMLIFGTIGIFRKFIPLSSSVLAMLRGFIGMGFLLVLVWLRGRPLDWKRIRQSFLPLAGSGVLIGLNWIALFESYRYTSVAVATLCYYMAPVIVILAAPLVLKERLTPLRALCAALAFVGMVLVSGVLEAGGLEKEALKGIGLGLAAACLYAWVIMINKRLPPVGAYDRTIVQLGAAAGILLPYSLMLPAASEGALTWPAIGLVAVVGIVHTGLAYALYFGSMKELPAQTVALYSYIDPVTAIVLSLAVFGERISLWGWIGAVLILGSTLASDLLQK